MALGAITYKSAFPCLKTKYRIIKVGIPKFGSNTFSFSMMNQTRYYYLMRNNIITSKNAYLSISPKNYIGYIITTVYLEKSFKLL